jgi:hypothetical protein
MEIKWFRRRHILSLTATPMETALIFRMAPLESAKEAIFPVEKAVSRYSWLLSRIHLTAEHGPEPLLACSL